MKHSGDEGIFQTSLLQALQKNKVIQDKLTECQHTYYIQLIKEMQNYNLKEKYNRELLYTWKKESYARQLRKHLEEYEHKRFGAKDPYYEYQIRNLGNIIYGQRSLVIPPSEQKRRLNVNAKYRQFLRKNPLQSSSIRVGKSAKTSSEQSNDEEEDDDEEEEEMTHGLQKTWKNIHAQSAVGPRRTENKILPNIHRSSTMDQIRRKKTLTKSLFSPRIAGKSSALVTTTSDIVNTSSEEKFQRSPPAKSASNYLGLPDGIEPLLLTSETLDKHTRADLVTMRSVRRPRQSPWELNLLFETRKRIYQINKRALDHQLAQRKLKLLSNIQFDLPKQIDSTNEIENVPDHVKENDHKHQSDQITI